MAVLQRGGWPPPPPFRLLSRRSGRIPALPYPPLRYFQSGSPATSPATLLQRTAITPSTSCLTQRVHPTDPSATLSPFPDFPVSPVIRFPAPPISRRGEEGFSSCSVHPCHRAVATAPPECPAASVSWRRSMQPSPYQRGLGL